MGMKKDRCVERIDEPSVIISGCFEGQESLNWIDREPMIEGENHRPLLDVARLYIEITGAKSSVKVFQELFSKYKVCYFKRCLKLAEKFSFECMGEVILKEGKDCYYIIDGTHRLVVYAVRLLLGEEREYCKVKCFVYKKAVG